MSPALTSEPAGRSSPASAPPLHPRCRRWSGWSRSGSRPTPGGCSRPVGRDQSHNHWSPGACTGAHVYCVPAVFALGYVRCITHMSTLGECGLVSFPGIHKCYLISEGVRSVGFLPSEQRYLEPNLFTSKTSLARNKARGGGRGGMEGGVGTRAGGPGDPQPSEVRQCDTHPLYFA